MISASRARAESRFSEIERRQQKALSEQQQAMNAVDANTARLKALRLAKAAADEREAEELKQSRAAKLAKHRAKD